MNIFVEVRRLTARLPRCVGAMGLISAIAAASALAACAASADETRQLCQPYEVKNNGEVVENLEISVKGGRPGILVSGKRDVVIRNVKVFHDGGPGIVVRRSDNLLLDGAEVINVGAPEAGALTGANAMRRVNIRVEKSDDVRIRNVVLERGASGVYVVESDRTKITSAVGRDFRGPLPRGQFVQFDKANRPTLEWFAVVNPGRTSWAEDAINSFSSVNPVIRHGYIEGINSPTGIGVQIENDEGGYGGFIENIDVRYWVNGAFMAADGASNVTFRDVRACDGLTLAKNASNIGAIGADGAPIPSLEEWAGENFRGLPRSGQQAFYTYKLNAATVRYEQARYFNLPIAGRVAWGRQFMSEADFDVAAQCDTDPRLSGLVALAKRETQPSPPTCEND